MVQPSPTPKVTTFAGWVFLFLRGMCMGVSDLIPGISGGTVAFLMGIYEDLLNSIKTVRLSTFFLLFQGRFQLFFKDIAWGFLSAILGGIVFAMLTLAHFFDGLLNDPTSRVYLYGGFFGLILASIFFCAKQISRWKGKEVSALALGGIAAFFLTGTHLEPSQAEPLYHVPMTLEPFSVSLHNYDTHDHLLTNVPESTVMAMVAKGVLLPSSPVYSHRWQTMGAVQDFMTQEPSLMRIRPWLVICGALAVCAMLLPGISGSYLLTILGVYSTAIGAVADFSNGIRQGGWEAEAFWILSSLLIGIAIGAALFSRVAAWLLNRFPSITLATLAGFMIGALPTVWPFWSYHYSLLPLKLDKGPVLCPDSPLLPDIHSPFFFRACGWMLAGFFLVLLMEYLANRKKRINTEYDARPSHGLGP